MDDFHDPEHARVMRESFSKKVAEIKTKEDAVNEEKRLLLLARSNAKDSGKTLTELDDRVFHDEERRLDDALAKLKEEYRKLYKDEVEKGDPDYHDIFRHGHHPHHSERHADKMNDRGGQRRRDHLRSVRDKERERHDDD
jgi:hypothetical protein